MGDVLPGIDAHRSGDPAGQKTGFAVPAVIKSVTFLQSQLDFSEKSCIVKTFCGEMVEWFKAAVLKTAVGQLTEGSNPSLSAIFLPKMRDSLNKMKAIPKKHF